MVSADYQQVTFRVQNDDDGTGPGSAGSPAGTIIFNEEVIFSDENLQAVGNEVRTTIADDPGLELSKVSDKDLVTSAESFVWQVDYVNNSHATDDIVTITDTLPATVILDSVFHEWNAAAVANGQAAGSEDVTADPGVTITSNADGTTTVVLRIAGSPGFLDDLLTEEGGRILFNVRPVPGTPTGTVLLNRVTGYAENPTGQTFVEDVDPVTVANPDLTVSKFASNAQPATGEEVTYTLVVSNAGLHSASNVTIADTLPAGVSYVGGSTTILTAGYEIGEPGQSGSTLTWSDLRLTGGTNGFLPAQSGDIYISYRVTVTAGEGTDLPNTVVVSTTDPEEPVLPNESGETVRVPYPDPLVVKGGTAVGVPGEETTWDDQLPQPHQQPGRRRLPDRQPARRRRRRGGRDLRQHQRPLRGDALLQRRSRRGARLRPG